MRAITKILSLAILLLVSTVSFAGQAEADALLARINHELDMLKPLINQAQEQAPKSQRVVFHYDWLRADINNIQNGINEELNQTNLAPRVIEPIKGDYQNAPSMSEEQSNG